MPFATRVSSKLVIAKGLGLGSLLMLLAVDSKSAVGQYCFDKAQKSKQNAAVDVDEE